jgi:hypothetical protein
MTDIDRATALALIRGRLSDYPVIRRLPDELKAELEPLERGRHYGELIERLAGRIGLNPPLVLYAITTAAKAQEAQLADARQRLEAAVQHNMDLRAALEKSAAEIEALRGTEG